MARKSTWKPRRKTAAEILAGTPRSEWTTPFACRQCGTIGCNPDYHTPAPRSFDPGAIYLRAVSR
jgi:hypothetical protein